MDHIWLRGSKSHKYSKWGHSWAILLVTNWLPPCISMYLKSCILYIVKFASNSLSDIIPGCRVSELGSVGCEFDKRLYWGDWPYQRSGQTGRDKAMKSNPRHLHSLLQQNSKLKVLSSILSLKISIHYLTSTIIDSSFWEGALVENLISE